LNKDFARILKKTLLECQTVFQRFIGAFAERGERPRTAAPRAKILDLKGASVLVWRRPSGESSRRGYCIMAMDRRYCAICAWRGTCQKKFSVSTDATGQVHCADYSRDLAIKDKDIEEAVKKEREG
jgi:hypothetical protein